jgi:ABC-type amino acid transport substrate-binding protein
MRKCSTLVCLGLVTLSFLSIGGCQKQSSSIPEDTFKKIKREGVLKVGYLLAPPWIIRNPATGELSGVSVDTINEIGRLMEVRIEFIEATWATFVAGLQSGKYDLSICPTFSTIPRAKSVAFTRPQIYIGNSAIVRKKDGRFRTLKDIDKKGVVIAVTQGEQGYEYAKANFKNAEVKVLSVGDQALTFSEVVSGRADVALGDAWFSRKFAETHPEAHDLFAQNPYNLTPVAWAVRYEDMTLLTFINTCLDYLDSTGKLAEFDKKYDAKWLRLKKVWAD